MGRVGGMCQEQKALSSHPQEVSCGPRGQDNQTKTTHQLLLSTWSQESLPCPQTLPFRGQE